MDLHTLPAPPIAPRTPSKVKKPAKKVAKKKAPVKKVTAKTKARKVTRTYKRYVHQVLPKGQRISRQAAAIADSFAQDLIGRFVASAKSLVEYDKARTLQTKHVRAAVRLVLPRELADHAQTFVASAMARIPKVQKK